MKKNETTKNEGNKFLRNIIGVVIAFLIVIGCYKNVPSYKWVHDGLLAGNYEFIKKNKNLTTEQKFSMKIGFSYNYLKFIADNTPDTAVILFPPNEALFPPNETSEFRGATVTTFIWRIRFLYPRKVVQYTQEGPQSIYSENITHVAIANGWGYELLNYDVARKVKHTVLPIEANK